MNEGIKSPLIRGKPAWHVRYMRIIWVYFIVDMFLLAGQFVLIGLLKVGDQVLSAYSIGMFIFVFGGAWWMARWLKGYGLSYWKLRSCLKTIDGVPCPNCLYPLCELDEADAVFVCPECGCGIRGADAIRAWESLRGYVIPESWGQAWERRLDGIGE